MRFFILFLLLPCAIIAQGPGGGYRNYRVVGADTGPNPYIGGSQMNSFTGIETIGAFSSLRYIRGTAANAASKNGKLLFYTNGYSVCDKYGNVVPNGDSLTPTPRAYNDFNSGNNFQQNSFIFQHKADSSLYTMIHTALNDYSIAHGPLAAWISEFKINADSSVSVIKKTRC